MCRRTGDGMYVCPGRRTVVCKGGEGGASSRDKTSVAALQQAGRGTGMRSERWLRAL